MNRYLRLASVSVVSLLAVSLSASAGSTNSFSNVSLTGVSGTVSGSFTFTGSASGGTFSNLSLAFNGGMFGGDKASNGAGKAKCALGVCEFSWKQKLANGVWVSDTILFYLKTGLYQDFGGI